MVMNTPKHWTDDYIARFRRVDAYEPSLQVAVRQILTDVARDAINRYDDWRRGSPLKTASLDELMSAETLRADDDIFEDSPPTTFTDTPPPPPPPVHAEHGFGVLPLARCEGRGMSDLQSLHEKVDKIIEALPGTMRRQYAEGLREAARMADAERAYREGYTDNISVGRYWEATYLARAFHARADAIERGEV